MTKNVQPEKSDGKEGLKEFREMELLLAVSPVPLMIIGREGDLKRVNGLAAGFFGVPASDVEGKLASNFVHPKDTGIFRIFLQGVFLHKGQHKSEFVLTMAGGSHVSCVMSGRHLPEFPWALFSLEPLPTAFPKTPGAHNSDNLLPILLNSGLGLIGICTLGEGRFLEVNQSFLDIMGYTRNQVIGKTSAELEIFQDPGQRQVLVDEIRENGVVRDREVQLMSSQKQIITGLFSADLIIWENQSCMLSQVSDVSRSRQIEERLGHLEKKFQKLFETMAQGVFYQNADGTAGEVNTAALDMFGLSRDQFFGRTSFHPDWKVVDEDMAPIEPRNHPSMVALSTGQFVERVVGVFNPQKDKFLWLHISARPQFHENETKPFQVIVTLHDLTDHKAAEKAIKETARTFQDLFENNQAVQFVMDPSSGQILISNQAACHFYGYSPEEMTNLDYQTIHHPNSINSDGFWKALAQGNRGAFQVRHRLASGLERDVLVYTGSFQQKGKDLVHCIIQDVTGQNQAERRLRDLAGQWQSTFDAVNDAIWLLDRKQQVIRSNKAADLTFGKTKRQTFRLQCWEVAHSTSGPIPECPVQLACKSLKRETAEILVGDKWYLVTGDPVFDDDGTYTACVHVMRDITQKKQADDRMRNQLALLRRAGETAMFGGWNLFPQKGHFEISEELRTILECPPQTDLLAKEAYRIFIEEDHRKIRQIYMACFRDGLPFDEVFPARTFSGNLIWVRITGERVMNGEGEVWLEGSFQDVTELQHKQNIQASLLKLEDFSHNHTLDLLLEETINEAEKLTFSKIGFIHFVDEDQEFLRLQNWSTRTKRDFCTAEGKGSHYPIAQAGVWVDCVHQKKPVIHNDYASLTHRKGLPPGHATVVRELVVPIFRTGKVAAILGVGNKPANYGDKDIEALTALANLAWDISSRKQTEEFLKESETRFRQIFESAPIGMLMLNDQLGFLKTNPAFRSLMGYTENELAQKSLPDLTHPAHQERLQHLKQKLFTGEAIPNTFEKRFVKKDSSIVWGEVHLTVIRQNSGAFLYFLAMIKDSTERKVADEKIQKMNTDLRDSNMAKDKFFSILAHDLKNPFNTILGFSELVVEDFEAFSPDEVLTHVKTIHRTALHTLSLLENLLDWARMKQGQIPFNPSLCDLSEIIRYERNGLTGLAEKKAITLEFSNPGPLMVHADLTMVSVVIRNLITNAIKFTPHHGAINLELGQTGTDAIISVVDNGMGMSPETINQLFKAETGFSTRGTDNERGTGLGLLLCREFVEKHGGRISVESSLGKGSRFWFSLPLTRG